MPSNLLVAEFVFGALLILVAILGKSGFKLFDADIPGVNHPLLRILAGILGITLIVLPIIQHYSQKVDIHSAVKTSTPSHNSKTDNKSHSEPRALNLYILSKEQIRAIITKALHAGDATKAVNVLRDIKDAQFKSEECERVYTFCIKNNKLIQAETVANDCWKGRKRKEALEEIAYRRLQQQ